MYWILDIHWIIFHTLGKISAILLLVIISALALIHFYWAAGGKWGLKKAIPITEKGNKSFSPGPLATALVGFCLLFLAYLVYAQSFGAIANEPINGLYIWLSEIPYVGYLFKYSLFMAGILFLLRAIGDFKYAGFFKNKKHSETEFGKMDTQFFSPLCLFISILFFILNNHLPFLHGTPF